MHGSKFGWDRDRVSKILMPISRMVLPWSCSKSTETNKTEESPEVDSMTFGNKYSLRISMLSSKLEIEAEPCLGLRDMIARRDLWILI